MNQTEPSSLNAPEVPVENSPVSGKEQTSEDLGVAPSEVANLPEQAEKPAVPEATEMVIEEPGDHQSPAPVNQPTESIDQKPSNIGEPDVANDPVYTLDQASRLTEEINSQQG